MTHAISSRNAAPARIILVRHGETDWNHSGKLQGHIDIPLNAQGHRQAAALADRLAGEPIDFVISSDLARARQTAIAIADRHGLYPVQHAELRERAFGGFEGMTHGEIEQIHPQAYADMRARLPDASLPPGAGRGETLREFHARSCAALTLLAQQHAGKLIVVVAHGGVVDCIRRAALGLSLQAPRAEPIANAGIWRLAIQGDIISLLGEQDISHLDGLALDEAYA